MNIVFLVHPLTDEDGPRYCKKCATYFDKLTVEDPNTHMFYFPELYKEAEITNFNNIMSAVQNISSRKNIHFVEPDPSFIKKRARYHSVRYFRAYEKAFMDQLEKLKSTTPPGEKVNIIGGGGSANDCYFLLNTEIFPAVKKKFPGRIGRVFTHLDLIYGWPTKSPEKRIKIRTKSRTDLDFQKNPRRVLK